MRSDPVPIRAHPDTGPHGEILALIRRCFASMEGRIDPPSSMHRLTPRAIAQQCRDGEVWVLGRPPIACMFLTPRPDCLYLGKLAVDARWRGQGLARLLVEHAERRARALGLRAVKLQTRVELVENHAAFAKMGFVRTGESAHPGYDRPTSITLRRAVN
ncbi:MAG: N-acetyltransferase [Rhodobacteraceae bacterium CG17_big_fil_post_rev_8_21_14_2_50_63_15]|nr:GNAT family N-acetyltransferase [Roseovarius sp.]PIV79980.1 MAG: N-acetyltransferase [Rhodobacteraceae bacterium CG17_big_fil_post_rev_8_21_14_2_50_63_15]